MAMSPCRAGARDPSWADSEPDVHCIGRNELKLYERSPTDLTMLNSPFVLESLLLIDGVVMKVCETVRAC